MSDYIKEYMFENPPKEINYFDDEPLKLSENFIFYHNKNSFRKELNRLQNLFKDHTKNSLISSGIRDTYLKEEYFDNYLLVLFTTGDFIKDANKIIELQAEEKIDPNCFLLVNKSDYMLLLAKDMDGLNSGIDTMHAIFEQTFKDYFNQKKFDDYIKIRQFKLLGCSN